MSQAVTKVCRFCEADVSGFDPASLAVVDAFLKGGIAG